MLPVPCPGSVASSSVHCVMFIKYIDISHPCFSTSQVHRNSPVIEGSESRLVVGGLLWMVCLCSDDGYGDSVTWDQWSSVSNISTRLILLLPPLSLATVVPMIPSHSILHVLPPIHHCHTHAHTHAPSILLSIPYSRLLAVQSKHQR